MSFSALKIVLIIFLAFLSFLWTTPVYAQDASVNDYGPQPHADYTLDNVAGSINCSIADWSGKTGGLDVSGCSGLDKQGHLKIYNGQAPPGVEPGALETTSNVVAALYNYPPVSSKEYLADLGSQMGIVSPAYAQGVGGSGQRVLEPILNLWKVFRNLSYLTFIIIFVVIGFMIMLRQKLNPQTVISIQSALPSLVIGLVLVTFSYFISALIVDLSFVGMRVVAFTFVQSGLKNIIAEGNSIPGISKLPVVDTGLGDSQGPIDLSTQGNIFGLYYAFIANTSLFDNIISPLASYFNATEEVAKIFGADPDATKRGFLSNLFNFDLGAIAGQVVGAAGAVIGFAAGTLISTIILLALLIQMVRLIWAMLSSYITILVLTIFSPILIAIGSIPGRGAAISFWWKTILGNVLIFPAIFFAFLFAGTFLAQGTVGENITTITGTLPLFAGIQIPVLKALIGYGIVLGSPAIPGMVKQALGVKDLAAIQQAAFGGIAAGWSPLGKGISKMWEPRKREAEALREGILRYRAERAAQSGMSQGKGLQGAANVWYGVPRGYTHREGGVEERSFLNKEQWQAQKQAEAAAKLAAAASRQTAAAAQLEAAAQTEEQKKT